MHPVLAAAVPVVNALRCGDPGLDLVPRLGAVDGKELLVEQSRLVPPGHELEVLAVVGADLLGVEPAVHQRVAASLELRLERAGDGRVQPAVPGSAAAAEGNRVILAVAVGVTVAESDQQLLEPLQGGAAVGVGPVVHPAVLVDGVLRALVVRQGRPHLGRPVGPEGDEVAHGDVLGGEALDAEHLFLGIVRVEVAQPAVGVFGVHALGVAGHVLADHGDGNGADDAVVVVIDRAAPQGARVRELPGGEHDLHLLPLVRADPVGLDVDVEAVFEHPRRPGISFAGLTHLADRAVRSCPCDHHPLVRCCVLYPGAEYRGRKQQQKSRGDCRSACKLLHHAPP